LTIVALGTSLPELAAAIASAVRKEDDLCIGNILGSNLFNLLGVLGIAALVHPMIIEPLLIQRDLTVMTLIFVMLAAMAFLTGRVGRLGAGVLLTTYVAYQIAVFAQALG
ncbi:MAG: sodium:calcium antiporter, partial [Wenzhouxiangellaceae bacterium]